MHEVRSPLHSCVCMLRSRPHTKLHCVVGAVVLDVLFELVWQLSASLFFFFFCSTQLLLVNQPRQLMTGFLAGTVAAKALPEVVSRAVVSEKRLQCFHCLPLGGKCQGRATVAPARYVGFAVSNQESGNLAGETQSDVSCLCKLLQAGRPYCSVAWHE